MTKNVREIKGCPLKEVKTRINTLLEGARGSGSLASTPIGSLSVVIMNPVGLLGVKCLGKAGAVYL